MFSPNPCTRTDRSADCSFEIENGDFDYTSDKHCLVDANLKSVRSSDEHAMLCLVSYLPENYEQKQSNISNRGKANCKGKVVASVKFTKDSCQEITTGDKYHYMVVPQTVSWSGLDSDR